MLGEKLNKYNNSFKKVNFMIIYRKIKNIKFWRKK